MFVGRMLRAGGVGMRHPDGRHADDVGEHVIGQRAAEIGQQIGLAAGRLLDRTHREFRPRVLRVEACRFMTMSSVAISISVKPWLSRCRRSAGMMSFGSVPTTKRSWQCAVAF